MGNRPAFQVIRGTVMSRPLRVLRLDASANPGESTSRKLGDELIRKLRRQTAIELRERDLNRELSFIDSFWIGANFTAADERSAAQAERLSLSDRLIAELRWADRIVLTTPMYNFGVPATLKAWIDLVCRAGVTFRYTDQGPVGLLDDRRVDIVVTSGGVPLESPADFVSGYLKQVFSFIGIEDVKIAAADRMNVDTEASLARALAQIEASAVPQTVREVA
jgi:FMN-dependent NADH-azoreductase